jgi:hypothetical protein
VPDRTPAGWTLVGFLDCLDAWVERESPADDIRYAATSWILTRYDDPYQGVRRENRFPNLWFGAIPNTGHGLGYVVGCAYWIDEATRTVECDSFATLSLL